MSFEESRVKHISSYILSKYGSGHLGLFRLLCSFPYFREALTTSEYAKLQQLLAIPMISFERVLKEKEDVLYTREGNRVFRVSRGGRSRTFDDDLFCSVSGFVVGKIREEFAQYERFPFTPLLAVGRGYDIGGIVDSFNFERLSDFVGSAGFKAQYAETLDDDVSNYNNAKSLLTECVLTKMVLVEETHDLLVALRKDPPQGFKNVRGKKIDFAKPDEVGLVMYGSLERSLKAPPKGFKPKQLEMLEELFEDVEHEIVDGDFILYESVGFFEWLGLPETPGEEFYTAAGVKDGDAGCVVGSIEPAKNVVRPVVVPAMTPVLAVGKGGMDFADHLEEAFEHVVHYAPLDLNNLPAAEKVCALFGTEEGEKLWFTISKIKQKKLAGEVPGGCRPGKDLLVILGNFLREASRSVDAHTLVMLAAGRFVCWKGQYQFSPDGMWEKK